MRKCFKNVQYNPMYNLYSIINGQNMDLSIASINLLLTHYFNFNFQQNFATSTSGSRPVDPARAPLSLY